MSKKARALSSGSDSSSSSSSDGEDGDNNDGQVGDKELSGASDEGEKENGQEDDDNNDNVDDAEEEEENGDGDGEQDVYEDRIQDLSDLFIGLGKNAGVSVSSLTGGFTYAFLYNLGRLSCRNGKRGSSSSRSLSTGTSSSSVAADVATCNDGARCHMGATQLNELKGLRHLHPTVRQECYNTNEHADNHNAYFRRPARQTGRRAQKGRQVARMAVRSAIDRDGIRRSVRTRW